MGFIKNHLSTHTTHYSFDFSENLALLIVFLLNNSCLDRSGQMLSEKDLNAITHSVFPIQYNRKVSALLNKCFLSGNPWHSFQLYLQKDTHCISHFLTRYIFIRFPYPHSIRITSRTLLSPLNLTFEISSRSSETQQLHKFSHPSRHHQHRHERQSITNNELIP